MEEKKIKPSDFDTSHQPTWCPGCGNFAIWTAIKMALAELGVPPYRTIIAYGVGCAGNMNNYIKAYNFHSLHGRSLPPAVGAKLANHKLTVLAISGDGDAYGEGGNHLIHAARTNVNITHIVANNHSYSLTTGQSSPTSAEGYITQTTPWGEVKEPINPIRLVLSAGATFVARGFAGDPLHLKELIKKAVLHKGFSHIDILQQCVTFNHIQTLEYYRERVYKLEDSGYKPDSRELAFQKAGETKKIPIGIFYEELKPSYEESFAQLKEEALVEKELGRVKLDNLW